MFTIMLTLEEKKEKVKDFRPIDDAFFETLADDTAFCKILYSQTEWTC